MNNLSNIKPGQRVKYLAPAGIGRNGVEYKEVRGKVVLNMRTHLVVNLGGKHGRPGVCTPENFLGVVGGAK